MPLGEFNPKARPFPAFSNSNNVSFGINGGTVTASCMLISVVGPGVGGGASQLWFTNVSTSNNVSFNLTEANNTNGFDVQVLANAWINVSGGTTSSNLSNFVFSNSNGVSFGLNGSTVTASVAAGGGGVAISAGTNSTSTGTVVFSNSNGITFGMNTTGVITGSYTVPSTAGLISAINVSAGTTSSNISNIVFSNSNGVSFGLNGSTVTASAISSVDGIQGIIAGTQTMTATSTLSFVNSNNVSFGLGSGASTTQLTASYALNVSAGGGTSNALSAITFSNSNGITFGLSTGVGVGTLTASYTVPTQTNQTMSAIVSGNTTGNTSGMTFDARSHSFQGYGGVSVGLSTTNTGSSILISGPATSSIVAGANITLSSAGNTVTIIGSALAATGISGIVVSNTTYTSGTVSFSNANGISFGSSAGQAITASYTVPTVYTTVGLISAINVSAGTTSTNATAFTFSNSNGMSFGLSSGAGAGVITGSYTVPSTAGLISAINIYGSNTNSNLTAVSFANGNGLLFSLSTAAGLAGTLVGSYTVPTQTNQTVGFFAVGNTTSSLSSGTFDARSMSFDATGPLSVGYSNGSIVFSAATVAGQTSGGMYVTGNTTNSSSTTLAMSSWLWNALGAQTIGFSNGSIQLSAPASSSLAGTNGVSVSTAGSTISYGLTPLVTRFIVAYPNLTTIGGQGNASVTFQYFAPDAALTASRIDALASIGVGSVANTSSVNLYVSAYAAVYSRNASTLSSMSSGSTQTTYIWQSNSTSSIGGAIRPISVPVNVNMFPGEYFVGFNIVTAIGSPGGATTNAGVTLSMVGGNQIITVANYGEMGVNTATSSNLFYGMGIYSAASTGLSGAYSISGINQTGSALAQANIALVFRNA